MRQVHSTPFEVFGPVSLVPFATCATSCVVCQEDGAVVLANFPGSRIGTAGMHVQHVSTTSSLERIGTPPWQVCADKLGWALYV